MSIVHYEDVERNVLSVVFQALYDYRAQASKIFQEEIDQPQDIAEDITREAIAEMGLSSIKERLYGKVDVKKAIYVFLPQAILVALMLDAKAEKDNGNTSATIQMSQTSMRVRMRRKGKSMEEQGRLPKMIERGERQLYVATIIAKYVYAERMSRRKLKRIIVACIPNGYLQDVYNPSADDTIWLVGRNAPALGEDFRVRLSYPRLRDKAGWRIRTIVCNGETAGPVA